MSIVVEQVRVQFGGVTALKDVSLRVEPGQIVTVIGPNGSGKSTLFNSITGMVKVASGAIQIDGKDVVQMPAYLRIAQGLARSFQTPRFDPRVNVEDAVLSGFYPVSRAGIWGSIFRWPNVARQEHAFHESCERILSDFGLSDLRQMALGELPMGQVRMVEVARAIANQPSYLLLDEPAAGLTRTEQQLLASEIRRVASSGVGVLLVEHNFALVKSLSDHTIVLDRGSLLLEGEPETLMRDPIFVAAYLGNSLERMEATV